MTQNAKAGQEGALPLRPAATFFGAPTGDIEDLGDGKVAVAGVYCDHFSAGAPGGRYAARQIRYTSAPAAQAVTSSIDDVIDLGDFNVFPLEPARTEAVLAEQCEKVMASGARLLSLGGDYSVSPALLKGIAAARDGSIGLIRISSRLDLSQQDAAETEGPTRPATTARMANIVAGGLSNIAFLGTRGPSTIEEVRRTSASKVIPAAGLAHEITQSMSELRAWMSRAETFYLSLDADVLAARYGSTALRGASGGLTKDQILNVLAALEGMPFVAAELTGHLPNLDVAGRATTSAFAEIAFKLVELLRAGNASCH